MDCNVAYYCKKVHQVFQNTENDETSFWVGQKLR